MRCRVAWTSLLTKNTHWLIGADLDLSHGRIVLRLNNPRDTSRPRQVELTFGEEHVKLTAPGLAEPVQFGDDAGACKQLAKLLHDRYDLIYRP